MVVGIAVAAALVGFGLAFAGAVNRPTVVTSVGRAGDLTLEVAGARWMAHDEDGMAGMPMAGMPPAGFTRLHLEVTLENQGSGTRSFDAGQFRLEADQRRLRLATTSFVPGDLAPGQAMAGDLFFDVPEDATEHPVNLEWRLPGRDLLFRLDGALGRAPHRDGGHTKETSSEE